MKSMKSLAPVGSFLPSYQRALAYRLEAQAQKEKQRNQEIWQFHYRSVLQEMYALFQNFWTPRPCPLSWSEFQLYVYQNTRKEWDSREHKYLRPLVEITQDGFREKRPPGRKLLPKEGSKKE